MENELIKELESNGFKIQYMGNPLMSLTKKLDDVDITFQLELDKEREHIINIFSDITFNLKKAMTSEELDNLFSEIDIALKEVKDKYKSINHLFK